MKHVKEYLVKDATRNMELHVKCLPVTMEDVYISEEIFLKFVTVRITVVMEVMSPTAFIAMFLSDATFTCRGGVMVLEIAEHGQMKKGVELDNLELRCKSSHS